MDELFLQNGVGICSKRDETAIKSSKNELINVLNDFKKLSEHEIKQKYRTEITESRDKKTCFAKQNILTFGIEDNLLQRISYRPFETKWTYFTNKSKGFLAFPVYELMEHFKIGENIGLVVSKQCDSDWRYAFVTENIADLNLIARAAKFGGGYIFPLYLYIKNGIADNDKSPYHKRHNLNDTIIKDFCELTGLEFSEEHVNQKSKIENQKSLTPIDIFDYIYAVLHSPAYRGKYKEFLKIDFPRIPYPNNAENFYKLAVLGERLRKLHLLENINVPNNFANYPIQGNDEIEKLTFEDRKVWINHTQYFDNVPIVAWNFYIGGYQPAQKWLKDRKDRKLEEKEHYRKIIYALTETARIMGEIN